MNLSNIVNAHGVQVLPVFSRVFLEVGLLTKLKVSGLAF